MGREAERIWVTAMFREAALSIAVVRNGTETAYRQAGRADQRCYRSRSVSASPSACAKTATA